ncbi:MAG: Na(+)-translocating NADH-quinone reductase subunit A [Gammaproteobacteria bacterium]|nr:Na(+)-translocating NADH-quinone reductase subunit A [Gammaproteobacteria bacterium]
MAARPARTIRIRRGLDLPIAGEPLQEIADARPVKSVALLGQDYRGIRPELMVAEGHHVRIGQPLFRDRKRPDIVFTSPAQGVVEGIHRGARRALQAVVVRLDDDESKDHFGTAKLDGLDRDSAHQALLTSGLWVSFRTRPFSAIPDPGSVPRAIFVTAIDTNPLAADPATVLNGHNERRSDLADGLSVLNVLTDGAIFFCRGPGLDVDLPDLEKLHDVCFDGPHPAGLPGTHIHHLAPVDDAGSAWHVGYQDVVAIGRLFRHGELWLERVIAIGGPSVQQPRLLRTRLGASTEDLLAGELAEEECRVISGSVLSGHRAAGWGRYLGRYHSQISVVPEGREREFLGWLAPGFKKYSAINSFASSILRGRRFRLTASQHGSPRAMVPIGNFEKVMPLDILPAPLLKALLVRDTETARSLGCLELDEEDLALCSFVCCSKYDYGPALRETLNKIEQDG